MKAERYSTIDSCARTIRQFLLLTLLLSSVVFGVNVDYAPLSGKLLNLPSQLNLISSDHVALIGQQEALRTIKRLNYDDSADLPWLLSPSVTDINLPSHVVRLRVSSFESTATAVSANPQSPRAPPVFS